MNTLVPIMQNLILFMEFIAALVGLIYYSKLKNMPWKWFVYYLVLIFCFEAYSKWGLSETSSFRKYYYDFIVIPFEFIFLFWLYAYKTFEKKKLFWILTSVYVCSLLPHLFYLEEVRIVNSLSYTVGNLLVFILVVMEYHKQLKSDSIIKFYENKMFYVNAGILLLYVGTLPLFAFDKILYEHAKYIWLYYYSYFLLANCLMYGLFAASFIWGKQNT